MNSLLLIFMAAIFNNIALTLLKVAGRNVALTENIYMFLQTSWLLVIGGALFYCISFLLTIKILADNPFLIAVPSFIGINFLIATIVGLTFFKESATLLSLVGICFICIGVLLISKNAA